MPDTAPDIDLIDLKILSVLQDNGRISNLRLAEAVALSPTDGLSRVQRPTRAGYLLKTRLADIAAYRDFAGAVLWQLPGVREIRIDAAMEDVTNATRLPLPVQG
ncbi:MAG: AsnC family transcriptional regulator [Rhodoferax sp.]